MIEEMRVKKLSLFTRKVLLTFLGESAPTPSDEADALLAASTAVSKGLDGEFQTDTGISIDPNSKLGERRMLTISIQADLLHGERLVPVVIAALKDYVSGLESRRFGNDDAEDFRSGQCRVLTISS